MHENTAVEPFVIDFRPYTRDPNEGRPVSKRRASGRRGWRSSTTLEKEAVKRYVNRMRRRERQGNMLSNGVQTPRS